METDQTMSRSVMARFDNSTSALSLEGAGPVVGMGGAPESASSIATPSAADLAELLYASNDIAGPVRGEQQELRCAVGRSKKWPRIVAGLFFVSVAFGIVFNRNLVISAFEQMRNLSLKSMLGLFLLVSLVKILHTTMHWASLPGVSFPHVFQATESYVGASNTVVGGAGLGTGLRVAMLRSWGVSSIDVAVSIVATALAPSFALWTIATAHTLPLLVLGRADRLERLAACLGVCFLAGPGLFWWAALRFPSVLAWVSSAVHMGRLALVTFIPSKRVANSRAANCDLPANAEIMRERGRLLARSRGFVMVAASICAQVTLGLLLIGCVQAVSPVPVSVKMIEVLRAFALLRVLSSFVPLPAGLGVLDLGLLGVLTNGGVARPTALAAIAMYRALTFVVPMITGSLCAFQWRTSQRRAKRTAQATGLVNIDLVVG
jgi:putative heme transporter